MKICLLTMHGVYNYGSALQTYATCQIFKRYGYDVEIVDYYPKRMRNYGSLKQLYTDAKPFHKKTWTSVLIALCKYPSMRRLKRVFVPFSDKYFKKSCMYSTNDSLINNPPIADVYCTGSDQVWNDYLEGSFDKAYFLDFAPEGAKKIAFSASFGREDISDEELLPVKNLLSRYDAISVREETGLQIIRDIDVSIKECILDPTFLLSGDEWKRLATPIKERDYLLVYQLHEDSITSKVAIEIGKILGKKVLRISTDYLKRIPGGKTIVAPGVEEFISYISNAYMVVTDSFHATAFSINLNVPFISIQWKMFNDRIGTILNHTGLRYRSVSSVEDAIKICNTSIDFSKVNCCLDNMRKKSFDYLDKILCVEK